MFGISIFQILIIMLVVMLVVGPQKLPEYAKKAGAFIRNVKRYTTDMGKDLTKSLMAEDKSSSSSGTKKSSGDVVGSFTKQVNDVAGSFSEAGKSLSSFLDSADK